MANRPTVSWDNAVPVNGDAFSLGDDKIRELKKQIREIFEEDHIMESTGQDSTWGYHKKATLIEQGSNPPAVANTIIFFTKAVNAKCELHFIDEDSNVMQLTSGGEFIGGMANEIRMWSGTLASIPTDWVLCDGAGGTINLIGKFIKSSSGSNPGSTGGSDSIALITSNLPTHAHTMVSSGSHAHQVTLRLGSDGSYGMFKNALLITDWWDAYVNYSSSHTHTVDNYGSGSAFNNRPAYFELAFIQRS